MLNFIYYPVSFILWCWHKVFGSILGDTNAIGWGLSIVFLVFTLRAIMLKPTVNQIRSMRKMQEFAPQIKAIQKKYANDRQRQAVEMQKLQREHGVNPVGGCLPMLLQIPVFIGLNHVLRSFTLYPNNPNYFFPKSDVLSYGDAKFFGAHFGDAIFNTGIVAGHTAHATWMWGVAPVAIPLMVIASIATHFTARLSARRQMAMNAASTPQTEMMQKLTMWVFPLGVLVFGGALPVGLLMYWVSNNVWTFGQQHFVFGRMDREEEEKKAKALEQRHALAPKPGQKPTLPKKTKPATGSATRFAPQPGTRPQSAGQPKKAATTRTPNGQTGKGEQDNTTTTEATSSAARNGNASTETEISGLVSGQTRKKKQGRKSR